MGGAGLLRRRPGRRLGVSRASLYRALDALAGRGILRREGRPGAGASAGRAGTELGKEEIDMKQKLLSRA